MPEADTFFQEGLIMKSKSVLMAEDAQPIGTAAVGEVRHNDYRRGVALHGSSAVVSESTRWRRPRKV